MASFNASVLFACAIALASCSDEAAVPSVPAGCNVLLAPGSTDLQQRVQTALIEARSGSTVCFLPGTYMFTAELSVSTPNITVRGTADGVVFDFRNQRRPVGDAVTTCSAANGSSYTAAGFTIQRLTIKKSP